MDAKELPHQPLSRFESAVDAVIIGDIATLAQMLREKPDLISARSARKHGAMLLHYVSANGVEDYRKKTPKNIVDVTTLLLAAGAEVDATLLDNTSSALGLIATSIHPARAGMQIELMETLLEAGASIDGPPQGWNIVNG